MKKFALFNGIILIAILMSGCTLPYRMYQQKPPENINSEPVCYIPVDVGVDIDEEPGAEPGEDSGQEPVEKPVEGTYVENVSCGYLCFDPRPERNVFYLICDEEDIEIAETELGMKVPEDADWPWDYEAKHIKAFQDIKSKYPIDQYNYLFEYQEYSCLGYSSHADNVVFEEDRINFHFDEIKKPGDGEMVCEAMDGEFKIAAIPKEYFEGRTINNVVRPSEAKSGN